MAITLSSFNHLTGSAFADNESNNAVLRKINAAGATLLDVRKYTESDAYKNHGRGYHVLREFLKWYKLQRPFNVPEPTPDPDPTPAVSDPEPVVVDVIEPDMTPEPAPIPSAPEPVSTSDAETRLLNAMRAFMGTVPATLSAEQIEALVDDKVNAAIAASKPAVQTIRVELPNRKTELPSGTVLHKDFKAILSCVEGGMPVYLYGPSGSGKSEIAKQVAKATGRDYYFTGKVDLAYDLLGYNDANGNYVETPFYKAVKNGGLFLFDEIDASSEEALTAFNAVLNSGECSFPCGIVQAHENFRVMAAGNTCGLGGTGLYNSRRKLDEATRNRFVAKFEVGYDPKIEEALGDEQTVKFVQTVRKVAERAGIELILSYRNIKFLSAYVPVLGAKTAVAINVLNGLSDDDRRTIKNDYSVRELCDAGNALALAL